MIIGVLAIKLALGDGGKATNQQGAMHTIVQQPLGKVLLVLAAIGLAGYALWRLVRAALGHGPEDSDDAKDRVAALGSGLGYAALCASAVKILVGSGGGNNGHPDKATAGVLGWPGGPVLVVIAGLVVIGVGLYQGKRGVGRDFLDDSKTWRMSEGFKKAFTALGVFGHLARMVVFALVGWFLIKAAIDYKPHQAVGLDGALSKLAHASFGPLALGVVAAGLIGFGLFSIVDSRYRKV
jgi:Domain of Unknown Function (DUF1206)